MLNRDNTSFDRWYFRCTHCPTTTKIMATDEFTLRIVGPLLDSTAQRVEVNMEPVSLRASSAFYAQSDSLLINHDGQWLDLLNAGRSLDLQRFLGETFGYPGQVMTEAEKQAALERTGLGAEWRQYRLLRDLLPGLPEDTRSTMQGSIDDYERRWDRDVFTDRDRGSPRLVEQIGQRRDWVRRYDPIRMAAEHRTFREEKLRSTASVDGKPACADVTDPDRFIVPTDDELTPEGRTAMLAEVCTRLRLLGIADFRLIRNLEVCEYSFGYTRTSALPTIRREKNSIDRTMPSASTCSTGQVTASMPRSRSTASNRKTRLSTSVWTRKRCRRGWRRTAWPVISIALRPASAAT